MSGRYEDLPDILTVPQVARFLRVGRQVVYRMIRERRLPAMKFGRAIRISKRAFGAVLERGELNDVGRDETRGVCDEGSGWAERPA